MLERGFALKDILKECFRKGMPSNLKMGIQGTITAGFTVLFHLLKCHSNPFAFENNFPSPSVIILCIYMHYIICQICPVSSQTWSFLIIACWLICKLPDYLAYSYIDCIFHIGGLATVKEENLFIILYKRKKNKAS